MVFRGGDFVQEKINIWEEMQNLKSENDALKQEVRDLRSTIDTLKSGEKEITNVDLLRRISQLEKIILGREQ